MRTCKKCGLTLDKSKFRKDRWTCNPCRNEMRRSHVSARPKNNESKNGNAEIANAINLWFGHVDLDSPLTPSVKQMRLSDAPDGQA